MIFSQKPKGFFVEMTDHAILLARTSGVASPLVIEDLQDCPAGDKAALEAAINRIHPKKLPSGVLRANVGIYPQRQLLRRHSLDLKRIKEPAYISEVCTQQFRIEEDKYVLAVINASDGLDYDFTKAMQKEVIFCGLPNETVISTQNQLLESKIYPEALELGSLSTLGAVVDYLNHTKSKTPTLVLEVGLESTQSFIVTGNAVEASRPIPQGLDAMVPIVQKELGLQDEESARKLFYSNTFDFTGMGPLLIRRLLKELQSSIGFYEVQTGQSVGQVLCTQIPAKLRWLDGVIASALGITSAKIDPVPWLQARQITLADTLEKQAQDPRWLGLLSLIVRYNAAHATAAEEKK